MKRIVAALDPAAVQFSGDEPLDDIAVAGRPVWKAIRVATERDVATDVVARVAADVIL